MSEQTRRPDVAPPAIPKTRSEAANTWCITFIILCGLAMCASFLGTGYLFGDPLASSDSERFNGVAALAGAAGTLLGWLPIIALFDYLRREEGS